jgi:lactate dehydrogenase-like 2-hydroxyacid dehydrogenase
MIKDSVTMDSTRLRATVEAMSCWPFVVTRREASIIGTGEMGNAVISVARAAMVPVVIHCPTP